MKPSTKLLLMLVILMRAVIADIPAFASDVFEHHSAEIAFKKAESGQSSPESLKAMASWLSAEFGLPIAELPNVEFVASEQMRALRHRGVASDHLNAGGDILAVYDDDARTIYLPSGWTGRTVAEASILVHELVHHAQNLVGMKVECPQAREKMAYEAQQRWLRRFGGDLAEAFGIDGFTLLVLTSCGL